MSNMTITASNESLKLAQEEGAVHQCPRHPEVWLKAGAEDRTDLPLSVTELVESMPAVCPLCSEEDD